MGNDLEWMSKHAKELKQYYGKWIAVKANKGVIASGNSVKEVMDIAKRKRVEEPLVTKVPRKDEEMVTMYGLV